MPWRSGVTPPVTTPGYTPFGPWTIALVQGTSAGFLSPMTQNGRSCSVLLLVIVLALSVLEGDPPVGAQGRGALSGIVTHVADGDTLDITANGQTYTVRLDGIDAPEGGQAFGREARVQLRVLAFSKPATATVLDRDRYGRTVARVIVAGRDLSEEMVRAACRARTGSQAATSRAVGRSVRGAALAVSERS